MIAIWTYESINGKPNFCKAEIYAIVASVLLWKHFNPTHIKKIFEIVCETFKLSISNVEQLKAQNNG